MKSIEKFVECRKIGIFVKKPTKYVVEKAYLAEYNEILHSLTKFFTLNNPLSFTLYSTTFFKKNQQFIIWDAVAVCVYKRLFTVY